MGSATATPRLFTPTFAVLFAAALAFFAAGSVVLPVASRFATGPLGADAVGVGISIGAFAVAALVLRPVVGWASDRFGRRPLLLGGCLLTVAALALHLVSTTLPIFIAARSLLGVGEAFFLIAALAAISDLAPPERQGEGINIGSLSLYVGLAIGPALGETVLEVGGFTAVWLVAGALAVVATLLSWFVPETAPVARRDDPRPRTSGGRLFHPAGLFPGFLILTGAWGMAGFFAFLPLHVDTLGIQNSGLPFAIYAVIVIGLRLVFAKLPDQVGPARLSGAALAATAVGLAILGMVPGLLGLYAGTVVFAVGVAFMFPGLLAVAVARVDETERGTVVGTTSVFLDLSFGLAPSLLGLAAGTVGFSGTFLISALVAAGGFFLIVLRRETLVTPAAAGAGTLVP
ncbi:MAG TPA: MFS transporter [Candidatus Saccharimonadales bacterium]|nr:MFS transporter [Candidatus Saccharimonadales bacterium]